MKQFINIDPETKEEVEEVVKNHSSAIALGAAMGAVTKQVYNPPYPGYPGGFSTHIGSVMGSAAANGSGLNGAVSAGAAVVTAKASAIAAVGAAALPFVAVAGVAGVGYWLYKNM